MRTAEPEEEKTNMYILNQLMLTYRMFINLPLSDVCSAKFQVNPDNFMTLLAKSGQV
jgi:hypothetical protein